MSKHPADSGAFSPDPSRFPKQIWTNDAVVRRPLSQFRVVLLNKADLDLMFVVRTVMEVTRFGRAEATHRMWQAHHDGRAVILTTHRERAELFVELLAVRGLDVTLEPN